MSSRLEQLLEMLQEDPSDSFLHYAVGLEYVGRNDWGQALHYFESLRERDPDYLATYYQLGAVYEELDRIDDARGTYEQGIKVGRAQNDLHTVSELQGALENLD